MEMMQKLMKKNNKGFSLVELIVVILIIGILAVALAPQVMKWVGTAGDNQVKNEAATIESAVQTAASEAQAVSPMPAGGYTATITKGSGVTAGTPSEFKTALEGVLADGKKIKATYDVKVATSGAVTIK